MVKELIIIFLIFLSCLFADGQNLTSYQYDKINRITQIALAPCKFIQYQYDQEGNRISQQQVTIQVYDSVVKSCYNQSTGKVYLKPVIIGSRYRFIWNTGFEGPNLINIAPGIYTVTIIDSSVNSSCQLQFTIDTYSNDIFSLQKKDITCAGMKNGEIAIIKAPSTFGTFEYSWSTGSHDSAIKNLPPALYSGVVTNLQTGCKYQFQTKILEPYINLFAYPNPTTGITTLEFCSEIPDTLVTKIFNIQGQLLQQSSKQVNSSVNQITVDLSLFNRGVYFIELTTSSSRRTYRVLKL